MTLCTAVVGTDGRVAPICSEPPGDQTGWSPILICDHFDAVTEATKRLVLVHRRIGLTGLAGDGMFPLGLMQRLRGTLPAVEWVDVTQQLREIRARKSRDEVAVLQSAAGRLDEALAAAAGAARPSATELDVWGAAARSLVRAGSDVPSQTRWASGLRPSTLPRPTHAPLQRGSYFVAELAATDAGYAVHAVQPVAVQSCDAILRDLHAAQVELWHVCFPLFTPGRAFSEIARDCLSFLAELKARPGRYPKIEGRLQLEGCGLGSDDPSLTVPLASDSTLDGRIEEGLVFELKPSLSIDIGPRVLTAAWSDPILVSTDGPVRLGRRPIGLAISA